VKALGRVLNIIPTASGIHVSLKNAGGVLFCCYEDGGAQNIDIVESKAGASGQVLSTVTEIYAANGIGGVWTNETTDANGALGTGDGAIVKKDTTPFDCAVVQIEAAELSDGFDSVECTVDAGVCVAVVYDLAIQRAPENLVASGV